MKSVVQKKQSVLTCDDLPMPLLIHRQDNGLNLKFNSAAKKIIWVLPQTHLY
jgi:hypothetical protein